MRKRLIALLVVVLANRAATALELGGSLSGTVRDSEGGPLPGVTVTVTGPALQGSRITVTKPDGTFSFVKLPPGNDYRAVFALSGFQTVELTQLGVSVGKDTQANSRLQLARVSAEVTVNSERPTVDATQTNTQQNFSADYLRKIPIGSGGRDYLTILQQAPGVVNTGNPNVFGGNLLENNFSFDGVNTTDPVTHTFTFNFNFDAIQEVSVQTSSYLPEYGRASGGFINVVTKSGGNAFSGAADVRYSSNHFSEKGQKFDPSVSPSRTTPWDVALGGPILRDKLWFFGNLQRLDNFVTPSVPNAAVAAQLPPSGPVARGFKGWNDGLKLSFTVSPQLTGLAEVQDSLGTIPGAQNSALYRPEASATQHQRSRIYDGVFDGVINPNWSAELQIARFEDHLETAPTSGSLDVTQWVNIGGGNVRYDNYSNYQKSDRNRNLLGLNTTYFFEGLGSHQVKLGGDADRTYFPSINFTTGTPTSPSFCPSGLVCGAQILFRGFDASGNRIPVQQTVVERKPQVERDGRSYSTYIQDQWRPTTRLTLNAGVRYDRTQYFNNVGADVLNFNKLQPRAGFAFDVLGDGRNVFRGSYGQYYVDPALTFDRLFDTDITSAITRVFSWKAATQTWALVQETGGNPITQALIDRPLKPTYDDQINVGFERQLFPGASASVGYIYKRTNDIFEDSCTDQINCPDFFITNQPGRDLGLHNVLRKNYYGYEAQFQYQAGRWAVNANYVYSKSRGSIDSSAGQYAGTDFDHFPENFVNRYGYLDDDARHRVKIFAAYEVPVTNTRVAINYFYRTGLPYTVTHNTVWGAQFDEPRGTDRTPVLNAVDAQVEQPFRLRGVTLAVIGSIFNVFNSEQPLTYFTSSDSPSTVRTPLTYQRPRNYQVGFRAEF